MKSLKNPLLVPVAIFLVFIIEGTWHIYSAIARHDSPKIIANSIGIVISIAGLVLMAIAIKKRALNQQLKYTNKSIY